MTPRPGLSIIIPAYCEGANIVGTLENVTAALGATGIDAEILVIDDGSTDDTAAKVAANASRFPAVRLLTNGRNCGFGWTYRRGVVAASRDFIVMVHGDNAWGAETLADLFQRFGEADIVVGYTREMWRSRSWSRTVASKTFTRLVNLIARRHLHYYNGLQIHRADVLKSRRSRRRTP
jgi:glycosyltransferase involved in cell wall biosynthesis